MLDDFDQAVCGNKHYGIVLREEGGLLVMRCSFCQGIFKAPVDENPENRARKKSSKTCIQACDWFAEGKTIRCKACGYTGPLP